MRHRPGGTADLNTCRSLLPSGLRLAPQVQRELLRMWTHLLTRGSLILSVIEDPGKEYPDSIEAFGASVFVTETFARDICRAPRPYVSALVYEMILAGDSPVLDGPQIRDANSSTGLNLLVLHFGLRNPDLSNARTRQALQAGSAAFFLNHAGYRVDRLINEVFGEQHARYMEAGGFRRIGELAEAPRRRVRDQERPYLYALSREQVVPAAVNPLSLLFHGPAPILGFSPFEQRVLWAALTNAADVQIAARLRVSLDAIKKAWRTIYQRVARATPYLVADSDRGVRAGRSREKRRHLLDYLRTHPEELRPYRRPSTRAPPLR